MDVKRPQLPEIRYVKRKEPNSPTGADDRPPWLSSLLLRGNSAWLQNAQQIYNRLIQMPRRVRRRLTARFRLGLASLALVAALTGTPALLTGQPDVAVAVATTERSNRSRSTRPEVATTSGHDQLVPGVPHRGPAATIVVDGVVCTLADAIESANTNSAVGGCVAGSGADVIDLQSDVAVATMLPSIVSEMTIEGNGHIIDGSDSTLIMQIATASGDLTLKNVIMQNAYTDANDPVRCGAIHVADGRLTVYDSTFRDNYGFGFGGAIRGSNTAVITVNRSVFTGNTGGGGGGAIGLWYEAQAHIFNSTFYDNFVPGYPGGALMARDYSSIIVANSTIVNNRAGYGGGTSINNAAEITLINTTVAGNTSYTGGGVTTYAPDGVTTLIRSVVTGNRADWYGNEAEQYLGTIIANDHNLFGDIGETTYEAFGDFGFAPGISDINATLDGDTPTALGDIIETTTRAPLLTDNGGPTPTVALKSGSPALDIAPDADCTATLIGGLDQRGLPRNVDGDGVGSGNECDAGAYEAQEFTAISLSNQATSTPNPAGLWAALLAMLGLTGWRWRRRAA